MPWPLMDEMSLGSARFECPPCTGSVNVAASFAVGAAFAATTAVKVPPPPNGRSHRHRWLHHWFRCARLGWLSAWFGGAPPLNAALRVTFWGAIAMGLTAAVGWVFGVAV
jgi:hypothetical protein